MRISNSPPNIPKVAKGLLTKKSNLKNNLLTKSMPNYGVVKLTFFDICDKMLNASENKLLTCSAIVGIIELKAFLTKSDPVFGLKSS